jgi:hypothetical protein
MMKNPKDWNTLISKEQQRLKQAIEAFRDARGMEQDYDQFRAMYESELSELLGLSVSGGGPGINIGGGLLRK